MTTPAVYFKKYRHEIGFSNAGDAKEYLAAKDITPSIDMKYIEALQGRIQEVIGRVNRAVWGGAMCRFPSWALCAITG